MLRPSIVWGVAFALGAMGAAAATLIAVPRLAMERAHVRMTTCSLPGLRCAPDGVFLHQRTPDAPRDPALGPPEPDIIVSSAWIDLTAGPWLLTIPASGKRYVDIAVRDMQARRITLDDPADGDGARKILLAGRQWAGAPPDGVRLVPIATDTAWILVRIATAGEFEAAAVKALQDGFRISPLGGT